MNASRISQNLLSGIVFLVAALIIVGPLAAGTAYSIWGSDEIEGVSSPNLDRILMNTLVVALSTTSLATFFGVSIALTLEYYRIPLRRLWWTLCLVSFVIPTHAAVIAWIELTGNTGLLAPITSTWHFVTPYSTSSLVIVLALSLFPIVAVFTAAALRRIDSDQRDALRLSKHSWRTFSSVLIPLLGPGIATGALFVFLVTLVESTAPSLLQVPVLSTEIFTRYTAFRDYSGGLLLSFPMLATGALLILVWRRYTTSRRYHLIGVDDAAPFAPPRDALRYTLSFVTVSVLVASALLPLCTLVLSSLPLRTYSDLWNTASEEIVTSILLSFAVATCVTLLGGAMAYQLRRYRMTIILLCTIPFLLSAPAWGIASVLTWNHNDLRAVIYDHLSVVVFALTGRYLFIGLLGMTMGFDQIQRSIIEAARLSSASWWRVLLSIRLPLVAPWAGLVWGLTFMLTIAESDVSLFLLPPGATTISARVMGLMHYGPNALVAALCLVSTAVALLGATAGLYTFARLHARITHRP